VQANISNWRARKRFTLSASAPAHEESATGCLSFHQGGLRPKKITLFLHKMRSPKQVKKSE
jgi:hypothetical protein